MEDISPRHVDHERGELKGDPQDDHLIEEFGYTPVYRRAFRSIGIIGLCLSLASPMAAFFIVAWYQVFYNGYWGLTWGWFIPCVLLFPSALATAELSSSMPVNGAFYWYTAALAPPKWSRVSAYIIGWVNVMMVITSLASFTFALASSLCVILTMVVPDFAPTSAQQMGIAQAITLFWGALSFSRIERMNILFMCTGAITVLTSIIYIIGLPASAASQGLGFASGKDVFGDFENYSSWPQSLAVPFGWFSVMWSVTGWASGIYVAEETHDAARNVPRSIIRSFLLMSVIGLIVCIVTAFCITDMDSFAGDETGYPAYTQIANIWGTKAGFAFSIIIWFTLIFGGSGSVITSACQIAAFARDGGLPFPHIFTHVHPSSNIPIWSNAFLLVGGILILLFGLSPIASTIIYSLAVIAGLITYSVPMALRCFAGRRWVPGPFNLGKLSIPTHAFAVLFNLYMCIIECFPGDPNPDKEDFNYNWVFALGVSVVVTITWFFVRKQFKGLNLEALAARQNHNSSTVGFVSSDIGGKGEEVHDGELSKSVATTTGIYVS